MSGAGEAGQAVVEFVSAVVWMVLAVLLLGLVGQLLQIRLKTAHAANYVLWQHVKGMAASEAGLQQDAAAHFLVGGAGTVWRTAKGAALVDPSSFRVETVSEQDKLLGSIRPVLDSLDLNSQGLKVVRVRVGLRHLGQYEGMPDALVFEEQLAGLADGWQARNPGEVSQRLEHAAWLHPYSVAQKGVTHTVNGALRLLFGEVKADTHLVRPDVVPADRLQHYAD